MLKNILVIFGGTSFEHRISLDSAQAVIENLDKSKYNVIPLGISKVGKCFIGDSAIQMLLEQSAGYTGAQDFFILNKHENICANIIECLRALDNPPDIIFPVIHGFSGEDGKIQGLLELTGIPYTGTGVAGSAICIDKFLTKCILEKYNINQLPYHGFNYFEWNNCRDKVIHTISNLGYPIFIKPSRLGSSIGISRVASEDQLTTAIEHAFKYDSRLLAEKAINNPREIELALLGNNDFLISNGGEIIIQGDYDFYTYEAKYIDGPALHHDIPAKISDMQLQYLQDTVNTVARAVHIKGFSRIDFFMDTDSQNFYLNEINTIPDLTIDSMFIGLWMQKGYTYSQILDIIIDSALD